MIVDEILKIADEAYPDECVSILDAAKGEDVGDTLATFIALELQDVCRHHTDRDRALNECCSAMRRAIEQLEAIHKAILFDGRVIRE